MPERFPPGEVPGPRRGWYRIDLHVHSDLSFATDLTPEQVVAEAVAAGLDGFASTEHDTGEGHRRWAAAGDAGLLVILGQEVVTGTGHWLAVGLRAQQVVGWDYRARDGVVHEHVARVHDGGGLCVAAHPFAPYPGGTFGYSYAPFDAVEVWNGRWSSDLPWQADNETALAEWGRGLISGVETGAWLPAVGGSDAHLPGQVDGRLTVSCGDAVAGIGERLDTGDGDAVVHVDVTGVPGGTVTLHTDRGTAHRAPLPATGAATTEWTTTAAESAFVRAEVRHAGQQMAAVTNPVLLT